MAFNTSTKRTQIEKANVNIVVIVAIAAFVTTFSLVAVKALVSQRAYQQRVITDKEKARDQLKKNVQGANELVASYQQFVEKPVNIIGGSAEGTGDRDGDNAKIVLDALPSKYDFPALTVSMDKIMTENGFTSNGTTGSDDEVSQSQVKASANPSLVEIPFQISVTTEYGRLGALFGVFERTIRPMHVNTVSISGTDAQLNVSLSGKTYYLPAKTFEITEKVVQ